MRTFNLKDQIEPLLQERRILTFVEAINKLDSSVQVYAYTRPGHSEYNCLKWLNLADKARFPESTLLAEQLQLTKDLWIVLLMEEANLIQEKALSLHTISSGTPLTQKIMYDVKYEAAVQYVSDVHSWQSSNSTTDIPTHEQVTVPDIIYEEANRTGDPYYYMGLAIIDNYQLSQATLKKYYGQVEGERRVTKQRIIACANIAELKEVQWAQWPDYVGDPPDPED